MSTTKSIWTIAILLFLCSSAPLIDAAVKTEKKLSMTLWVANFPSVTPGKESSETVAVKGNRKRTISNPFNQTFDEIIDLDEERIYRIDMRAHLYTVTTFEERRRSIAEAQDKMKQQSTLDMQPQVDFKLTESDRKKTIDGYDCHEVILIITVHEQDKTLEESGGMVLTVHKWLAPKIEALSEIADFNRRYAEKLALPNKSAGTVGNQRFLMAAMARLQAESSKLEGTAILTTITTEYIEKTQDGASLRKGGNQAVSSPTRGGISTMDEELLKVSSDVDDTELEIPAGFKEKQ